MRGAEVGGTEDHEVVVRLDQVLAERERTLTWLSEQTGITLANLSNLKTGKARAIRFTSLTRICHALECTPGDLLEVRQSGRRERP